jgi:hypothetical protein
MVQEDWENEPTRLSRPQRVEQSEPTVRMGGQLPPQLGSVQGTDTVVIGGPPPSFAWLAVREGPRAGRLFRLNPEGTTVGRDAQCDVMLDDESVSRQHAKFKAEQGAKGKVRYSVWDLASSNGTFVNAKSVVKKTLKDGDEIRIGRTVLVYKQI